MNLNEASFLNPYIIAEIGVNHEGSLSLAKELIVAAKEGGAHAAKFQSYKAETLAAENSPAYWDLSKEPTASQKLLFKKYDAFEAEDFEELSRYCRSVGIDFLSTPFDDAAIEFLSPIVPFFKVASADLTNTPFLRKIAVKGKPIILSTGASTCFEIDNAVRELRGAGCNHIVLLHCILNYPTMNANANLSMIGALIRAYPELMIGYSDHTVPDEGMSPLIGASIAGSVVIEKHFTHDKTLVGNDHYHAMDSDDLKRFNNLLSLHRELFGSHGFKMPIETEQIARANARRSIVITNSLPAGHILTEADLTYKRPGLGISPVFWDQILGKALRIAKLEDDLLYWSDLEGEYVQKS